VIPFNYLGPLFKFFGPNIYPEAFLREFSAVVAAFEPGDSILDVGAGTGVFTDLIASTRGDLRIVSLDPAPGMLRYAPPSAPRVMGVAEHLPFGDHLFRAVLIGDAIHHLRNPTMAVLEMKRVLRTNGTIVIFDIDPGTVLGRFVMWGEKMFDEPGHFFDPEALVQFLGVSGFRGEVQRYGWRYAVFAERFDNQLSVDDEGTRRLKSLH
jgi:SAM-dependent methyltransferase